MAKNLKKHEKIGKVRVKFSWKFIKKPMFLFISENFNKKYKRESQIDLNFNKKVREKTYFRLKIES
jgi:hypothetical protein